MFKVVVLRKCELVGHADGVMNLALVSDQRLNQLLEVGRVDSGGSTVPSSVSSVALRWARSCRFSFKKDARYLGRMT